MGSDPFATLPQEHFLLHQLQVTPTLDTRSQSPLLTIPIQSLATGRLVLVVAGDAQRRKSLAEKLLAGF